MFLTIPFNMFYHIALKYGNFLLETLDTFPLLKDAYTQPRKLYENRISCYLLPGADPGFVVTGGVSRRGICGPLLGPQRVEGRALVGGPVGLSPPEALGV